MSESFIIDVWCQLDRWRDMDTDSESDCVFSGWMRKRVKDRHTHNYIYICVCERNKEGE